MEPYTCFTSDTMHSVALRTLQISDNDQYSTQVKSSEHALKCIFTLKLSVNGIMGSKTHHHTFLCAVNLYTQEKFMWHHTMSFASV